MLAVLRRWLPVAGALPLLAMFFVLVLSSAVVSYDNHLEPCELILAQGKLPASNACWECHQPPVYYLVNAAVLRVAHAGRSAFSPALGYTVLKVTGLLFALGTLVLLVLLTRRYFPARVDLQILSLGLGLATPLFLLTGIVLGNDVAVLFFTTLCLWAAGPPCGGLKRCPSVSTRRLAVMGALAGLAVLSKYNALAILPAGFVAVVLHDRWRGVPWRAVALRLAAALLGFLLVAGPWFVRNIVREGEPMPTRMARVSEQSQMGENYTLFDLRPVELVRTPFVLKERVEPGEPLPYLSHQNLGPADSSLWTRSYAGWWHDALYYFKQPPPLLTAAIYVAAFPLCLVALLGLTTALGGILRREEHSFVFVFSVTLVPFWLALYFAFVARYPWVRLGHARASLLVPLLASFALCWGVGYDWLTRRGSAWRPVLLGFFGILVALVVTYEGFLIYQYQ